MKNDSAYLAILYFRDKAELYPAAECYGKTDDET